MVTLSPGLSLGAKWVCGVHSYNSNFEAVVSTSNGELQATLHMSRYMVQNLSFRLFCGADKERLVRWVQLGCSRRCKRSWIAISSRSRALIR